LGAFSDDAHADLVCKLFGDVPAMAPFIDKLGVAPSPERDLFFLCFHSGSAARATCITSLLAVSRCENGASARPAIAADWGIKHTMQMHATAQPIPGETKAEKEQWRCLRAGVHLCGSVGDRLYKFRNAVIRMLKVRCPKGDALHDALVGGDLILCLVKVDAQPLENRVTPSLHDMEDACVAHIGLHYLSPYRPSVHYLRVSEQIDATTFKMKAL
jgi:hypothetical protein